MTPAEQQHVLEQMQIHYIMNKGNVITDVMIHGLLAVLTIVMSECSTPEQPEQPATEKEQQP